MINKIKVGASEHSIVPVLNEWVPDRSEKNPLRIANDANNNYIPGLTLAIGTGLKSDESGLYTYVNPSGPLVADAYGLRLKLVGDNSGLKAEQNGLQVVVGSGLTVSAYGIDINLKDPSGVLVTDAYGLRLEVGSDIYSDGAVSQYRSLETNYGLRLKLSNSTETEGNSGGIQGNALCSSEYGLTLTLGTSLTVKNNFLNVALAPATILKQEGDIVRTMPYSPLSITPGSPGWGGLALCLNLRDIRGNGTLDSLLTVSEGGALDIDVKLLKIALGLS